MSIVALTILASCSAIEKEYEQIITDFIQREKQGIRTDLKLQILSMETRICTVNDGICALNSDAEEEKRKAIAAEEATLLLMKKHLEYELVSMKSNVMMIELYQQNIRLSKQRIESLKKINPVKEGYYGDLNADTLLAVYVTCRYSISIPWAHASLERREIFVLSPDGKEVLGRV